MKDAQYWIEHLGMTAHPEGGFYKEVYRSENEIDSSGLPNSYSGNRSTLTSIYFLLRHSDFSHFHILHSDEIWYYHAGVPATIHFMQPNKGYSKVTVGPDNLQAIIPSNTYFAAELNSTNALDFILVSCAVAPGFSFDDFRMASADELLAICPDQTDLIHKLTL